ncbi:MAG: metallophosphoesterase family protein [Acidobacteria bacterium]|nr:metallophosphoesterase family protein [Acidobacteriota bacterium]
MENQIKLGVISDTHGNEELLTLASSYLIDIVSVKKIYHLGDNYYDADPLLKRGIVLLRVPGIFEEGYIRGTLPKIVKDEVLGKKIVLVHRLEDLKEGGDVILYGHTHNFALYEKEGRIFINPGHLKEKSHKGREATFALVELTFSSLNAIIYNTRYQEVLRKTFYFKRPPHLLK